MKKRPVIVDRLFFMLFLPSSAFSNYHYKFTYLFPLYCVKIINRSYGYACKFYAILIKERSTCL